jgi:arabinofuranosyltransferase
MSLGDDAASSTWRSRLASSRDRARALAEHRAAPFVAIALMTALAWSNRFVQDDAFISFRYADNLARGLGLVWNVGDRIEGLTNLLWTLCVAAMLRVGIDAVTASYVLGISCFVATLAFTWRLALALTSSRVAALVAIGLAGLNYSFSAYATGGLETQSQATVFVVAFYLLVSLMRAPTLDRRRLAWLSTVLGVALWVRLDSALMIAVVGGTAIGCVISSRAAPSQVLRDLGILATPFVVLTAVLVAFKLLYFGNILPNTFFAKATSSFEVVSAYGLPYLRAFALGYGVYPVVALTFAFVPSLLRPSGRVILPFVACIALWLIYVVRVGGDFMEFRQFVPIMPLAFCVIVWVLFACVQEAAVRVGIVVALLCSSLDHYMTTRGTGFLVDGAREVESIVGLSSHLDDPQQGWSDVGRALGREFDYNPDVVIAVVAAGAIPYYSQLTTIDMLGLNDAWVARQGRVIGLRPGHQREATLAYLVASHVNLIVHPWVIGDPEERIERYTLKEVNRYILVETPQALPVSARIIEVPITATRRLRVLYLEPSPIIDAAIQRGGWRVFPVDRTVPDPQ